MSKKVQASTGLAKSTEVKTDLSEKPKPVNKTKTAEKHKETAKSEISAKPENPASTKKTGAKSPQTEKAAGSTKRTGTRSAEPENTASTKKRKKTRSAQPETGDASTKKTGAKSEQPENPAQNDDSHEPRKAVRTPQVMKLVEGSDDVNPVLLAGKSRVPPQLRKKQSLTSLMRREMGEVFYDVEDTVVVNITELAIEHEAPEILDRFNACSCDKCVEIFSGIISERVPVRFARVRKDGIETGSRELSERVAPMRKIVITEMIKELIVSKKRCFHDDTK